MPSNIITFPVFISDLYRPYLAWPPMSVLTSQPTYNTMTKLEIWVWHQFYHRTINHKHVLCHKHTLYLPTSNVKNYSIGHQWIGRPKLILKVKLKMTKRNTMSKWYISYQGAAMGEFRVPFWVLANFLLDIFLRMTYYLNHLSPSEGYFTTISFYLAF